MKKYLNHMKSKSPHDRRQHAMQVAGILTALMLVVWVSTLGIRFASTPPQSSDASQLANVATAASNGQATLIVATTTDSRYSNVPEQTQ